MYRIRLWSEILYQQNCHWMKNSFHPLKSPSLYFVAPHLTSRLLKWDTRLLFKWDNILGHFGGKKRFWRTQLCFPKSNQFHIPDQMLVLSKSLFKLCYNWCASCLRWFHISDPGQIQVHLTPKSDFSMIHAWSPNPQFPHTLFSYPYIKCPAEQILPF